MVEIEELNQNQFDARVNRRIGDILNETEMEKHDGESEKGATRNEGRVKVYEKANTSFEELCDLVKIHPYKWLKYKIKHVFDGHILEIAKKVDQTIAQGNG